MKKHLDAVPILIALFLLAILGHMDYEDAVQLDAAINVTSSTETTSK